LGDAILRATADAFARRSATPCLVEWRYAYCGKLIGVWEPMVVCANGVMRETTSILDEQSEGDG